MPTSSISWDKQSLSSLKDLRVYFKRGRKLPPASPLVREAVNHYCAFIVPDKERASKKSTK